MAFRVRRAATWPLSPEWRKTIWPPNTSFLFLKFSFINKRWTFISANKQLSWKRILQKSQEWVSFSILICNIGQFTQLLNFWLSFRLLLLWKWNNNYSETIQCKELLRKTAKTCQLMTKRYFKNELKHFKRFDHVTDDVMSLFWSWKNYPVEQYFPANFLCRVIKGWLSTDRLFRSWSLRYPLNFKCRTSTGCF